MSAGLSQVITNFQHIRKEVCGAVQTYIKDTTFPLVDRWAIFKQASDSRILPEHTWVQDIDAMDDVSWYDDFYKDRYALVEWVDIIEHIEDSDDHKYFDKLDAIKEEILTAGYFGFTYDW